ncbi:MAG: alpha-L-fucosidase, partial [Lentisphaeria bacterium]|nr:alpha-L-fucosidase [Lentisphaeria bacterium]
MQENWFQEARFGLFIHWGIYSVPAGVWKGREIPRLGEQIFRFAQIPAAEYETIAGNFNPEKFDADLWMKMAADAGMKYVVFTAKHHDGFAMFDTDASDFCVTKATPFGRDIVRELAEACRKYGMVFCLYYSQRQDWHEPDGVWAEWEGQFPEPVEKREFDVTRYFNAKALPQMRELLTQYGPLGLIWYDTPVDMTEEQSRIFADLVHELQPDTLVCSRVGNDCGDYEVLGDNEFPYCPDDLGGEVPATMNHTWGYKSWDHDWKNAGDLLYSLIRSVANGCNYLLNVGPMATGEFPAESIRLLKELGDWMKINGTGIYGNTSVPFAVPPEDMMVTAKDDHIHLFFDNQKWCANGICVLEGICNDAISAVLPAAPDVKLTVEKRNGALVISGLPAAAPGAWFSMIDITLDGTVMPEKQLIQSQSGTVTLLSGRARVESHGNLGLDAKGLPVFFHPGNGRLVWDFQVNEPGKFRVEILCNRHWSEQWVDGIVLGWSLDGAEHRKLLTADLALDNIQSHYHPETISFLGETELAAGNHTLCAEILEMPDFHVIDTGCGKK